MSNTLPLPDERVKMIARVIENNPPWTAREKARAILALLPAPSAWQGMEGLPKPETMLAYASILEKPQYVVKNGVKFQIATGEIVEAACVALRYCAAQSPPAPLPVAGEREGMACGSVDEQGFQDHLEALRSANDGFAITVWKSGHWKLWQTLDAKYAEREPDWLLTIPGDHVLSSACAKAIKDLCKNSPPPAPLSPDLKVQQQPTELD